MGSLALAAGWSQGKPVAAKPVTEIPHLRKQGTATQPIVDGKPFLALAGVSWNQVEPQEGKFDFKVLDGIIQGRLEERRLVG